MRISVTKDRDRAAEIRQALKDNDGYCPCVLTKSPETKCLCKAFREQRTPGYCRCGLYCKTEEGEN